MRGILVIVIDAAACGAFEIVLSAEMPVTCGFDPNEIPAYAYAALPLIPAQYQPAVPASAAAMQRLPRMQGQRRKVALSPHDEYG